MKILIIGVNGFIGSHLLESILKNTDWEVSGIDIETHRIEDLLGHPKFSFNHCDFTKEKVVTSREIKSADVVIPLAAIATPKLYVTSPLSVFELDFEANLWVVRQCAEHGKRLLFPSTSEVYGMCDDPAFSEDESKLVLGPINKTRWIYSCSKQLLDRIIWSYADQGLEFTIFRPFNWIGANQDSIHNVDGSSRVISQYIGNILRNEPIHLVDGGRQKRSFLDISDGIRAILSIIEQRAASKNQIFNIGFPENEYSIVELAELIAKKMQPYMPDRNLCLATISQSTNAEEYYGVGYEDVHRRVPSIDRIREKLEWNPSLTLEESIERIVAFYLSDLKVAV